MLEAIIGAVFLETDYFYVSKFVYTLFGDELYSLDSTKDAKTVPQEYCQSNNIELRVIIQRKITKAMSLYAR